MVASWVLSPSSAINTAEKIVRNILRSITQRYPGQSIPCSTHQSQVCCHCPSTQFPTRHPGLGKGLRPHTWSPWLLQSCCHLPSIQRATSQPGRGKGLRPQARPERESHCCCQRPSTQLPTLQPTRGIGLMPQLMDAASPVTEYTLVTRASSSAIPGASRCPAVIAARPSQDRPAHAGSHHRVQIPVSCIPHRRFAAVASGITTPTVRLSPKARIVASADRGASRASEQACSRHSTSTVSVSKKPRAIPFSPQGQSIAPGGGCEPEY